MWNDGLLRPLIFIVRNGPDNKSPFKSILEKYFDVVDVNPYNSIMTELDTLIPALIIIDVSFNDQGAYQVSQQVKFSDKYHFIPLAFVGTAFSSNDIVKLIESGADAYFEEPFDNDTTISYLKALINKGQKLNNVVNRQPKIQKQNSNVNNHVPEYLNWDDEDLFNAASQQSAVGIAYTTTEGTFLKVNDRFCEIVGYTRDELLSKKCMDITYPDENGTESNMLNRMLDGDIDSFEIEKRYVHKSGYFVHVLIHANLLYTSKGVPFYMRSVLDITDIRTSQQRLKRSEEKYRTYVDNSPHPIFVTDIFGMLLDVNPSACNLTGYSVEELMGMNIIDLCSPESVSETTDHFLRVETEGKASGEFLFLKKDGTDFYIQIEAVMLDEKKLLALCVDTTERKLAENLLTEAKVLAENASNSKCEFLANISHELRTPLYIVIGYSDVLLSELSGKLNEDQIKYFTRIKEAGSSLLEIVNSLIYIAEIEAGNCELDIIKFNLQSTVVELEKIFRPIASKKNIMIEFEIEHGLESIFADECKFNAILHNLLENAIKFNKEGGFVKVIFQKAGNDVNVQVIDTGIGISEDKQETFFEPFVQLDWSHARRYSGVGIGLSLVKELVEMHGGKISLVSKVDEGSTFTFTIPQNL
ncbi:PAS domain S-box protein [Methanolobus sediminis]|uniref:histidine kinase n=1 Tax=Methanolobus sediminis TaxID=3072978 RepID=A0AA51YK70_9EURY|nr:PAS domain S-box protein [Methanolobus sediminis]WMW26275.1 PAS domain S-box protein [Methanolobus sediminis]